MGKPAISKAWSFEAAVGHWLGYPLLSAEMARSASREDSVARPTTSACLWIIGLAKSFEIEENPVLLLGRY